MPLRMNPFSRRTPVELDLKAASETAGAAFNRWAESSFAFPCGIYAGEGEGADPSAGRLTGEGKSRLWHFDYFSAEAERFLRVQVLDGKTSGREIRVRAGGLNYPQLRLPFAVCGYREDHGREVYPEPLRKPLCNSGQILSHLREAWGEKRFERVSRVDGFVALVIPGSAFWALGSAMPIIDKARTRDSGRGEAVLIVDDPDLNSLKVMNFDVATGELLNS